ncbi:hypothetical protein M413DRAFT_282636 [Hebeloma cylindrosporum]|uniref:Uncharacterized protein n=1 Tax=Hebeloma cylindrosporum TaxID=76867 RepID=A0A0C3BY14_HEBCY|nr:hypothetical protein M413DRAFT_282636 [Hebeloma cylindrosporum h7]
MAMQCHKFYRTRLSFDVEVFFNVCPGLTVSALPWQFLMGPSFETLNHSISQIRASVFLPRISLGAIQSMNTLRSKSILGGSWRRLFVVRDYGVARVNLGELG